MYDGKLCPCQGCQIIAWYSGITMNFKSLWADSRGKVIVLLVALWAAALVFQFRIVFVSSVVLAVAASVAVDSFLVWVQKKKRMLLLSSVVTGLLIGLVFDPLAGVIPILIACIIASISKAFLGNGQHKHVFNPAAFGIVLASLFFNRPVAWWGGSWGWMPTVIIAVGMIPILIKLRRLWIPLAFLVIYYMSILWSQALWPLRPDLFVSALRLTFDGTVFLFAFIMLPEPKTAPITGKWRYIWGIFMGLLVLVQNLFGIAVTDPLLLALLVANVFAFVLIK